MSAIAGPDADGASSSGQLGTLGSRASDGGKFAEGAGPEEVTVKKKRRNSPPSQYASCRNLPLPSPPRSQMSFHMFQRGQLFLPHPAMMDSLLFLTGLCTHLLWTLQCFVTLG